MAAADESQFESVVRELPSNVRYEKFNSIKKPEQYDGYCDRPSMTGTGKEHLKKLCTKFVGNLKNLKQNLEDLESTHDDRCTFYTFWVSKELSKIYKEGSSYKPDHQFFNDLDDILLNINLYELNKIYCDFKVEPKIVESSEKRLLHDFFKNSKAIYDCAVSGKSDCKQKYCDYVVYIKNLYDEHKHHCLWEEVCDYFDFNQLNPYEVLSKLKCSGYENIMATTEQKADPLPSAPRRKKKRRTGTFRLMATSQSGSDDSMKYRKFKCNYTLSEDGRITNLSSCTEISPDQEYYEKTSRVPKLHEEDYYDYRRRVKKDPYTVDVNDSGAEVDSGFLGLNISKSSFFVYLSAALLIILLFCYKFTSLGRGFGKKKKKKKNYDELFEEFTQGLSEHGSNDMGMGTGVGMGTDMGMGSDMDMGSDMGTDMGAHNDYYDDGYYVPYYST
ncbi:VIR protein [Plasmodium vivax]|uniref:VIR protein n=1 Tax=Plasmodium vivax TaxID=5855 RepID=A0A1G4H8I1_PLAVI|nr:VIR protein [Plasmodium vivax]